ncbi:hypothetical protein [Teichococcus aestuarii]|uniref:hypothetical protein n=1 Tax=Teichococcus aestuarii TaxID=568898 RepID=UPI00360FD94B
MLARELQPALGGRPVSILGTDICGAVLERARAGLYTEFEMQRGLSPSAGRAGSRRKARAGAPPPRCAPTAASSAPTSSGRSA